MITPYKSRILDPLKPVQVYRCLNRKGVVFSIRQNGLVVAHGSNFHLRNVTFKINEKGKQRCIESGNREVHAYACGFIQDELFLGFGIHLYYSPFSSLNFHHSFGGEKQEIKQWSCVSFNSNGVFLN